MKEIKTPLIHIEKLRHTYGDVPVLEEISLDIFPADIFLITGPSGVGKTTLISLIGGIVRPQSGYIQYAPTLLPRELGFGYALIDGPFFETLSVRENIFLLKNFLSITIDLDYYIELLTYFEMTDLEQSPLISLSAGQRERVNFIRAHLHHPKAIILDEPGANLDAHLFHKMIDYIQKNREDNQTAYIIVSHDTRFTELSTQYLELTSK